MSSSSYTSDIFAFSTFEYDVLLASDLRISKDEKLGFYDIMIEMYGNFKPVPLTDVITLHAVILVVCVFFNTLVAMYYRKSKTSN